MLNLKRLGTIVFLIASILLFITALTYPKDELIIDDFEDNDVTDWSESGFETISYKVSNMEPRGNVADIEIQTGQKKICRLPEETPVIYCQYGSFQKEINKDFSDYSRINFWIKFDDNYENIENVKLSFGEIVSGKDTANKVDYKNKPKSSEWKLVSFSLSNPASIKGELNLESIKNLRFNIEYGGEFYESKTKFHVYIDDVKLTKYSKLSILFFILSVFSLITATILFFYRETRRKLRRTKRLIFSLSYAEGRKEGFKIILNSTFQYLLIIYLILLLIDQFNPIRFLNLNYLLVASLIFGILSAIFPYKEESTFTRQNKKQDYFLILGLGILGAILIFIKTKELGWLSYMISTIAGILIILLSYLVLQEEEDEI